MNALSAVWSALRQWKGRAGAALDLDGLRANDAYLSAAVDVYDLERRIRDLDRQRAYR